MHFFSTVEGMGYRVNITLWFLKFTIRTLQKVYPMDQEVSPLKSQFSMSQVWKFLSKLLFSWGYDKTQMTFREYTLNKQIAIQIYITTIVFIVLFSRTKTQTVLLVFVSLLFLVWNMHASELLNALECYSSVHTILALIEWFS